MAKANPAYAMAAGGVGGTQLQPQTPGGLAVAFAMSSPLVMMAASPPLSLLKIRQQVRTALLLIHHPSGVSCRLQLQWGTRDSSHTNAQYLFVKITCLLFQKDIPFFVV